MKIRIRGNSLRLRLTRSEVEEVDLRGKVLESTHFGPDQRLLYSIESSTSLEEKCVARAYFDGGHIRVEVCEEVIQHWANSDQVSIETMQEGDTTLRILIEKDFQCLAPRGEDDQDAFPHPNADSSVC